MDTNNNTNTQQKKWEPPIFCKGCSQKVTKYTLKCPNCGKNIVKVTDVVIRDKK